MAQRGLGNLVYWLMDGLVRTGGGFLTPSQIADPSWRPVAIWDVDRDRRGDVVFQRQGSGRLVVCFMDGTARICGTFFDPDGPVSGSWKVAGPS